MLYFRGLLFWTDEVFSICLLGMWSSSSACFLDRGYEAGSGSDATGRQRVDGFLWALSGYDFL